MLNHSRNAHSQFHRYISWFNELAYWPSFGGSSLQLASEITSVQILHDLPSLTPLAWNLFTAVDDVMSKIVRPIPQVIAAGSGERLLLLTRYGFFQD